MHSRSRKCSNWLGIMRSKYHWTVKKRIFLSSKYFVSLQNTYARPKKYGPNISVQKVKKKKCKAHLLKKFNILAQCKNQSRKDGVAEMPIPIWPTVMPCMAVPVVEFPTVSMLFCNDVILQSLIYILFCRIHFRNV